MKRKEIIVWYAWCVLLFASCTRDNEIVSSLPGDGYIAARIVVDGMEGNASEADAHVAGLQGYRFEGGVLKEIITSFRKEADGTYIFYPRRAEGEICLLANAERVGELQGLSPDVTTRTDFLRLRANSEELVSEEGHVAMSGWLKAADGSAGKSEVVLTRSVARVDLSSFDKGVEVHRVTVSGICRQGYLNVQEQVETLKDTPADVFRKEYAGFSNRSEYLFYLPEQANGGLQAEILVSFGGAQHLLRTSLPGIIRRNTVYTLAVYGKGGNASVGIAEGNWEAGAQVESGKVPKARVDVASSNLAEGVRVNSACDSIFIPYVQTDSRLALLGEAGTEVVVEGQVEGVTVLPAGGRGLQPIASVSVFTQRRMPGTKEAYVYLEVYRQQVHLGRVVLVFEPNPIRLEGAIRLDAQGVCDFGDYVEGELGRLSMPSGKVAGLEFDAGMSRWMKLAPDSGAFRIIAGWKPNDPLADGRVQEARLVISDADGKNKEIYTIRRRNWGLPVVNIGGTWWCKYNLRGNVKSFSDQVQIGADPVSDAGLAAYLDGCGEEELLALLGHQYQAGYSDGYPLRHNGTAFYYEGMRASGQNFGLLNPEEMAPEGYRIPDYDDFAFFARSSNFNLGGQGTRTYRNAAGQELTVTIMEREVAFEGHPYGVIAFYEFQYEGAHWVLCGLGHQWNTTPGNIARMSLLFATYGSESSSWMMEGYAHTEKPNENWLKFVPQNQQKTRTVRCVKKPVEYIYE